MTAKNILKIEHTLYKIIARAIKRNDFALTPVTTFKSLGVDSLAVVQILVNIEDAFNIELADKDMKSIANMGELINYIEKKVAENEKNS
jgi:acyl carrier protein